MSKEVSESHLFFKIIAIIGAILIFAGVAWLIAWNWHTIPNFLKVLILVIATFSSFIAGVFLRREDHDWTGRALITLGSLLYILSLFLISQIYNLAVSFQAYAWILLLSWTIIFLISYLLSSPESLFVSLVVFFIWAFVQYTSSVSSFNNVSEAGIILGFVVILLCGGLLLYGLGAMHKSMKHKFTKIYLFWTAFYFLSLFYILSFQSAIPLLGNYDLEKGVFNLFLIFFVIFSAMIFIVGTLIATSKDSSSIKETLWAVGIVALLLVLVLSTKMTSGGLGICQVKECYDFPNSNSCNSVKAPLYCEWSDNSVHIENGVESRGFCQEVSCYNYQTEEECSSAVSGLGCKWDDNRNDCRGENSQTAYESCNKYNNDKDSCVGEDYCKWRVSYDLGRNQNTPTGIWLLWIVINFLFIGFIILMLWYGQSVDSKNIINLGMLFFVLDIISRYLGFWLDFQGYLAFSILAILGGIILIAGSWFIPKWRRSLLKEVK